MCHFDDVVPGRYISVIISLESSPVIIFFLFFAQCNKHIKAGFGVFVKLQIKFKKSLSWPVVKKKV